MAQESQDIAVQLRTGKRLSPTQRGFVASHLRHPDSASLNMALVVTFESMLDADQFSAAFAAVVQSSDVLRTQLHGDALTEAHIAPSPPDLTQTLDLTHLDRAEFEAWITRQTQQGFDLTDCCYRSVLATRGNHSVWFLAMHHVVTDATSMKLVIEQTIAAYFGTSPATSNFYGWSESLERSVDDRIEQQSNYWLTRQNAERLGRVYQASQRTTAAASRHRLDTDAVGQTVTEAVGTTYRMLNPELSWAAVLVTATAVYLHRLTGADDFAIGVPVHHRNTADTEHLVGPTMGVYPVDIRVDPTDTYRTLHRRTSRALMSMLANASPAVSAPGDYDAVVNVIPTVTPQSEQLDYATRWVHPQAIDPEHVLRVQATRYDQDDADAPGIDIDIDVHHDAASDQQRSRVGTHYTSVLMALATNPDASIFEAQLASTDELDLIRGAEQGPAIMAEPPGMAERLRLALHGNDDVVLQGDDRKITGDQLWKWARAIAGDLGSSASPAGRVAISLGPSIEAVAAIYGCVLANRPFVPLDPAQPAARTAELSRRAAVTRTFASCDEIAAFDTDLAPSAALPAAPPDPDAEAYLLFTSGSTGFPKAVPISHRGLARYIDFAVDSYFPDDLQPVAPLFTALTFDLTITSLFAPVIRGGRLIALNGPGPAALTEFAAATDLNWCKATPSHLEVLSTLLPADHQLAVAVVGGEAFRSDLAQRLLAHNPSMEIFNEYGPTEAVVGCMIHRVDPAVVAAEPAVPIGVPAPGVDLRVVDSGGSRVPIGVPGELWISSAGMTSGYLDEPNATSSASASPFRVVDNQRFYASGDLVTRAENLDLIYLGRIDDQLKVGGIRLDPSEVENALMQHPAVTRAAVRQWTPSFTPASQHCVRCGLPSNVPGTTFDDSGVCRTCHEYDRVAPMAEAWFRTEDDLVAQIRDLAGPNGREYDCLHLLSGGKDSTYALYKLVELGLRPYALAFDNGFISDEALDNVRRCAEDLGIDYEIASTPHINAIFRDSLTNFSDVCHGCYKTIYTLATNRAAELDIAVIVTGLSRGQLFETRLIPGQFQQDRFDSDAIDRAVVEARKRYHRAPDLVNKLLDTTIFDTDDVFESLHYIDIYRYLDVELTDVLNFLASKTPWQRPSDTGRSSNCLINIAGIHTHQVERGYHNYAEPYAWDVRLGHKRREASMAELDDPTDPHEIAALLETVGYTPEPKQVFTGWYQVSPDASRAPTPAELRVFLGERLPQHAIPAAFVQVPELKTTANGKLDERALPGPAREHRAAVGAYLAPETELESTIVAAWETALGFSPISTNDDFFALGGDSLAAVTMVVELGEALGVVVREELAFANTTPRQLAAAIQATRDTAPAADPVTRDRRLAPAPTTPADTAPELSAGELTLLFDQAARPNDVMYNVARSFHVRTDLDLDQLHRAALAAVARHEPLTWTYGAPRRLLSPDKALSFSVADSGATNQATADMLAPWQKEPFDLTNGPLLRCCAVPHDDGSTTVAFAMHHVSGDVHHSLDLLWRDIDQAYHGSTLDSLPVGYGDYCRWQRTFDAEHQTFWAQADPFPNPPAFGHHLPEADGFVRKTGRINPEQLTLVAGRTAVASAVAAAAAAIEPFFDDRVEVNLITSTRDHPAGDELFGYLLNPLPLGFDPAAGSLGDLASAASLQLGRHLPHRAYPFAEVVSDARRRAVQPPSGRVLVAYNDDSPTEFAGLPVDRKVLFNGSAVADVTFFVEPDGSTIQLGVEYRGTVVSHQVASLLLDRFDQALEAIASAPHLAVGDLSTPRLSFLEGPPLLDTELPIAKLRRLFTSDRSALEFEDRTLTWQQLGCRATQLAQELQTHGVTPGDRVAVRVTRSIELPVAIVGVLLCGASYVPIDPTYPTERIKAMVRLSEASVEVTNDPNPMATSSILVSQDALAGSPWSDEPGPAPVHEPQADDEAYLIFTSGSTGDPNGVAVTHGQLAASTNARAQFYDDEPTRFMMLSSVSFDSSVVGLFWTLTTGGTLLVPGDALVHDIDGLAELFATSRVSHVLCVPTLYAAILDRSEPTESWPAHVIVAGEACTPALVADHASHAPLSRLTNEYGPTEATVWATAYHCDLTESTVVPIGAPIAGTWLAVVDEHGTIRPQGVPGELVLGGPTIVAGYATTHDSVRFDNAQSILNPPVALDGAIFRTGDRVSLSDGNVVFLGRADDQLNIGGARVEPSEIERHLETNSSVTQVVVVGVDVRPLDLLLAAATQDQASAAMRQAAETSDPTQSLLEQLQAVGRPDRRLVAHFVSTNPIDDTELRQAVASLPATHRPTLFRRHDELPLLPNGKIDRAAATRLPVEIAAPTEPTPDATPDSISRVRRLFATTLHLDQVAETDSFFDLGGDSLRALELLRILEEETGARLSTSAIHTSPTPAALARQLDQHHGGTIDRDHDDTIVVPIQTSGSRPPIFVLHNLGVDASMWRPLSGYLGTDIPMYGIADPFALLDPFGESYNLEHRPEIHETAAGYVAHIQRLAPEGPLYLMGFCVGGVLGYEVAQQLTAAGRQVENFIIVLDWHAPHLEYEENWVTLTKMSYRRSGRSLPGYVYGLLSRRAFLKSLRRRLEGYAVRLATAGKLPLSKRLQSRQYVEEGIHRIHSYVYEPYDGRITVVRSTDDPRIPVDLGQAGWGDLVSDLQVDYMPGVGEKMLYEPHTETLSGVIRRALEPRR